MPFDAFLQFVSSGTNAPKVEGEGEEDPKQVPPSVALEIPGDVQAAAAQASPAVTELKQDAPQVDVPDSIETKSHEIS